MSKLEYMTTLGEYRAPGRDFGGEHESAVADPPYPPDGDGWQLVGMAAAGGLLFFAWQREMPEAAE